MEKKNEMSEKEKDGSNEELVIKDEGNVTYKEMRESMKKMMTMEDEVRLETYRRRRNIYVVKGKKWNGEIKLQKWIEEKAKLWLVGAECTIIERGKGKVVCFERKRSRNEFWFRADEARSEGQFELEEDLSISERAIRHELVRKGRMYRAEGHRVRIENRYLAIETPCETRFIKWNKHAGIYKVEKPREEFEWKKWNEKVKRREAERVRKAKEDW